MAQPRAKTFEYEASLDRAGRVRAGEGEPLELGEEWTPEHLLLAALMRCTLQSLRHHAGRVGIDLVASASAAGRVTKREDDERYAFVAIECRLEVELEPAPPAEGLRELLANAERDCFVGASLTSSPAYVWTVNGERVSMPTRTATRSGR